MANDCGNRFRNIGIEALVKKAKGEDVPDYIAAHDCCTSNEIALQKSKTCACFYCERVFTPDQIEEWIDDRRGWTALCPYCGIDAVIGDASGYPLTKEFLKRMYKYWFEH